MRLILINPNTSISTTEAMLAIAREAGGPSLVVDGLTAPFGAPLITDEAALATASDAVIALTPRLIDEEPDGVVVAAFGDPGLDLLRGSLVCPVTGIAEAGMAEAADGGRRTFAVVTTTPGLVKAIDAAAGRYGHAATYRGTYLTPGDPRALMADPERLVAALDDACRRAIADSGAAAIVIGGGPLAVAARTLTARLPIPLVEPVPAAIGLARRRASGPKR